MTSFPKQVEFHEEGPREGFQMEKATYPLAEPESVWHALYTAGGLFHDAARHVASRLGYSYNRQQAIAIGLYISKIRGNRLDR